MLHGTVQCQLTHSCRVCQNFQFREDLLTQKHDKQCLLPSQVLFVSFMNVVCQTVKVESFMKVLNRLFSWVELTKVTLGQPCHQICCVRTCKYHVFHYILIITKHVTIHVYRVYTYLLCLYNRCIVRHVVEA